MFFMNLEVEQKIFDSLFVYDNRNSLRHGARPVENFASPEAKMMEARAKKMN
jgi:hypothetical protein